MTEISQDILEFAEAMQQKLNENIDKGGWEDCGFQYLSMRLRQEHKEMADAETADDLRRECADVANFAMMIFGNADHFR